MTTTNQAVRFHQYGGKEAVKVEDVTLPEAQGRLWWFALSVQA
ncbi:hypothetical protein O1V64_16265 [Rouxiella badensis]|nr:hypothetical protein O1V64_16265 [Rouxiella badensis]